MTGITRRSENGFPLPRLAGEDAALREVTRVNSLLHGIRPRRFLLHYSPMRTLLIVFVLMASPAAATTLEEVRSPEKIAASFSPQARLRVINLWATWCGPCVAEMPELKAVDQAFTPAEVELIGVSFDDVIPGERSEIKKKVQKFLTGRSIDYRNFYYVGKMKWMNDHFKFGGELPLTIVLDSKGREIARHQGPIEKQKFIAKLRTLLRK